MEIASPIIRTNRERLQQTSTTPLLLAPPLQTVRLSSPSKTPVEPFINPDFLYTRSIPKPLFKDTIKETRTILRLTQLSISFGSFVALAASTFVTEFRSNVLAVSGVNFMCLVTLSSIFVSFSAAFLYFFPAFLGVMPHRHFRFSRIEVIVDLIYVGFWLFASSTMAVFGKCPANFFTKDIYFGQNNCLSWNLCFGLGFLCCALYSYTFVLGVKDLYDHGLFNVRTAVFQGARGSWLKQEKKKPVRKN